MKKKVAALLLALVMVLALAPASFAECSHETKDSYSYVNDMSTATFTAVDNAFHTVSGTGNIVTYCAVCGETLSVEEDVAVEYPDWHNYDDAGVCKDCGHKNTCAHERSYESWNYNDWSAVTYASVDDKIHTITGDGYTYTYCPDCEHELSRQSVAGMVQEVSHNYDDAGVCQDCGHENGCAHEHAYDDWGFNNWSAVTYTSVDDRTHTITGDGFTCTYCSDCAQQFDKHPVAGMVQEVSHNYDENGVCQDCGHVNGCAHEKAYDSWYFKDWDAVTYESVDNAYHAATGDGASYQYCPDCGQQFNLVYETNMVRQLQHSYDENGVCQDCGHVNDCPHEHSYESWDFDDWGAVVYTSVDNRTHTLSGAGWTGTFCNDCRFRVSYTHSDNMVKEVRHEYGEDGVCLGCGHVNDCPHEHTHDTWGYNDWDEVVYTSVDDADHTVSGAGWTGTYCEDCDTLLEQTHFDNLVKTLNHDYDENGVCQDCGHENGCTHENTHDAWNFDDWNAVVYTSVDNRDHTASGAGWTGTYCETCDVMLEQTHFDNLVKTWNHNYDENGVCLECGHVNDCTHENAREFQYFEDWDAVVYTPVDSQTHTASGAGWTGLYCEDCDIELERTYVDNLVQTMPHDYDDNNVCLDCGYENTCDHAAMTEEVLVYPEIYHDSYQHNVEKHIITKAGTCPDCGEELTGSETVEALGVEDHTFNADNVCSRCGYARPVPLPTAQPEAEPEVEPAAEPEAQPEAQPEAEPEVEPAAEPEAEPNAEPEAQPEAEPNAEPEAEPEAQPEAEPEAEPEAQPKTATLDAAAVVALLEQNAEQAVLTVEGSQAAVILPVSQAAELLQDRSGAYLMVEIEEPETDAAALEALQETYEFLGQPLLVKVVLVEDGKETVLEGSGELMISLELEQTEGMILLFIDGAGNAVELTPAWVEPTETEPGHWQVPYMGEGIYLPVLKK